MRAMLDSQNVQSNRQTAQLRDQLDRQADQINDLRDLVLDMSSQVSLFLLSSLQSFTLLMCIADLCES